MELKISSRQVGSISMAASQKDTIYIDIDDEITGIIDKLKASDGKVVALVLPKRAAVLQSIVNMRLLKRAADDSKKHVVLITSEAGLLPLAGAASVYVAKNLSSKPEIPTAPATDDEEETVEEEPSDHKKAEITAATAGAVAVGALAGLPPKDEMETVELDDDETPEDADDEATPDTDEPKKKAKKDHKLKVPNFDRFRLLLILGGCAIIAIIAGLIVATKVLPKATITITTDATNINVNQNLTLSTTATSLDPVQDIVPAKLVSISKTYTQQVTTTGQKNQGVKASGSVTMTAQECGSPQIPADVPAGSGVSANGLTYITQQDTTFSYSKIQHGCIYFSANSDTPITAQSGGANYNISSSTFAVAGRSDVTATGSASGGTDNNVQVVSQSDIDNAKSKITTNDASVKQSLQSQLVQAGYYAITATYSAGTPVVTTSANVGDAASSVTITEVITYTMFGAHQGDLNTLIVNNVNKQIDQNKQHILNNGLNNATFTQQSATATGAQLTMTTTATVGPELNEANIKSQIGGMKSGDVKSMLQSNPDVTGVDVKFSPFWVNSVPSNPSKVTIIIAKPTTSANNSNGTNP